MDGEHPHYHWDPPRPPPRTRKDQYIRDHTVTDLRGRPYSGIAYYIETIRRKNANLKKDVPKPPLHHKQEQAWREYGADKHA